MNSNLPNIWLMQTERNANGLITALSHPDDDIRRRAAAALRVIGAVKAIEPLKAALRREHNEDTRLAILAALEYLEPILENEDSKRESLQTRTERLIQHLTANDVNAAMQAAVALAEEGDTAAVPALIMVFKNKRQPAKVRLAVAEALLAMNSAPAEVTLLAALRSDKWHLRRNGAAILGQLDADWAVEPLTKALYDEHPVVAKTAMAALKRIGNREALTAIDEARRASLDTGDLNPRITEQAERRRQVLRGNTQTKNTSAVSKNQKLRDTLKEKLPKAVEKLGGDISAESKASQTESKAKQDTAPLAVPAKPTKPQEPVSSAQPTEPASDKSPAVSVEPEQRKAPEPEAEPEKQPEPISAVFLPGTVDLDSDEAQLPLIDDSVEEPEIEEPAKPDIKPLSKKQPLRRERPTVREKSRRRKKSGRARGDDQ